MIPLLVGGRDKQGKGFLHLIRDLKKYYFNADDNINIKGGIGILSSMSSKGNIEIPEKTIRWTRY
jgi:hypothetical protein